MLEELVRKHPLNAAELALAGAARGATVAYDESRKRILGRDADD